MYVRSFVYTYACGKALWKRGLYDLCRWVKEDPNSHSTADTNPRASERRAQSQFERDRVGMRKDGE